MLGRIKNYINYNYGSRRGWLNHHKFALHQRLGFFSRYVRVEWSRIERLVFVCHGNICRSPLAEAVAKEAGVEAVSYGLHCSDDNSANPRAIDFAHSIGLSLEAHRTKNIRHYLPSANDLLVVMEPQHLMAIPAEKIVDPQITLAGLWLNSPTPYLHDPYSAHDAFFLRCERRIVESTKNLTEKTVRRSNALA